MNWRDRAACLGMDTELFFPLPGRYSTEAEFAKSICKNCPVKDDCLRFALENRENYGIFGGLTQEERGRLLRRHPRAWGQHVKDAVRRMNAQGYSDSEIAETLALPSRAAVWRFRQRHLPDTVGVT